LQICVTLLKIYDMALVLAILLCFCCVTHVYFFIKKVSNT